MGLRYGTGYGSIFIGSGWLLIKTFICGMLAVEARESSESESESERYLFDPHKKLIQSNNEKQLGSGDPRPAWSLT